MKITRRLPVLAIYSLDGPVGKGTSHWKVHERGIFFAKNSTKKGKGSDHGVEPSHINFF